MKARWLVFEWLVAATLFLTSGALSEYLASSVLGTNIRATMPAFQWIEVWLPGFMFGIVFGLLNFSKFSTSLSFAGLSAAANAIAVIPAGHIAHAVVRVLDQSNPNIQMYVYFLGVIGGSLGAALLGIIADLFLDRGQSFRRLCGYIFTGLLFGLAYAALVVHVPYALEMSMKQMVGTALWQLAMGLVLTWGFSAEQHRSYRIPFEEALTRFLQGPTFQVVGVLGLVYGVVDALLTKLK